MSSKATSNDSPALYIGIFLLLVALLLASQTSQQINSHREYHQTLASSTVDILASEIIEQIQEKRRLLELFTEFESDFLLQLATSPRSPSLTSELESRIHGYFPNALSFTIATSTGDLLVNDWNDLIDERCRHDIFDFAAGLEPLPQIHSNPWAYHYDLMVRLQEPTGYVLFVNFSTSELVALLRNSHRPGHRLLLLNEEAEGLIEISEQGDRHSLADPSASVMDEETRQRVLAEKPIPNTRWRLVNVSTPELFPEHRASAIAQSLFIFALFLISSLLVNWLIQRNQRLRKQAENDLRTAKDRLEIEVHERLRELRENEELAEITLSSLSEGVITTNLSGEITALNRRARELTGLVADNCLQQPLSEVLSLETIDNREQVQFAVQRCLNDQEIESLNQEPLRLKRQDGSRRVVELSVSEITGRQGGTEGNVLVIRDITESYLLTHRISWQATHDALTGLINRLEFETRLQDALERTRTDRASHVLMYLDLDQFKVVNDTCGHIAGDELLKQISALLNDTARRNDTVARLGGDEFAILLEYCPVDRALELAEEVRDAIRNYRFTWDDKPFTLGVSIGVVAFDASFNALPQILSAADSACYAAKDDGRNRVHLYAEDDQAIEQRFGEMQWVSRIRQALDEEQFTLHGQRIMALNPELVEDDHIEVLLRLTGPGGELIMPGAFIPAAERYGLMIDIDRMVIQRTLRWLSESHYTGLVSINLSTQSMTDPSFLDEVFDMLCHTLTHPGQLLFEVTETAAITHLHMAQNFIERIRQLGCRFALDDFGSGMSSFGYLKHLPVDHLKIDGSFIQDIVDDPINYAMVKAIREVATTMRVKTVAEYVENDEILDQLKLIGIDYGQGHGIERPRPLESFLPPVMCMLDQQP